MAGDEAGGCERYERDEQMMQERRALENRTWSECADCDRGEEGSEEEKVLWADNDLCGVVRKGVELRVDAYGVVIFSVEMFEKTSCAPAAAEDDDSFF